jgi:hypothetical protein
VFYGQACLVPEAQMSKQMIRITVLAIILSLLAAPPVLTARQRRGAWLRIEKSDATLVEGELLKVSGEKLFLFSRESGSGFDVSLHEIRTLGILKKKKIGGGIAYGFLGGLVVGVLVAKAGVSSDPCQDLNIIASSMLVTSVLGMASGGAIGATRRYKSHAMERMPDKEVAELVAKLMPLARDNRQAAQKSK